jgi:hypothetical protein
MKSNSRRHFRVEETRSSNEEAKSAADGGSRGKCDKEISSPDGAAESTAPEEKAQLGRPAGQPSPPVQRAIQLVFQCQVPNQPVQIIGMDTQDGRRLDVIPTRLLHRI